MASRSVNNLRLSRDDMMNAYRETARNKVGGPTIWDIIHLIEKLEPIIVDFLEKHYGDNNFNSCSSMGYARDQDNMGSRCGFGMASRDYGNDGLRVGHVNDYADRVISEEEFERLLDYAEECNVKLY